MTEFTVHVSRGQKLVVIALAGYQPEQGFDEVGSFEHDTDAVNQQTSDLGMPTGNGDHPYINKAREVLQDADEDFGNLDNYTFMDRASNAAIHSEEGTATDDLQTTETGSDPNASSQKGGLISTEGTDPADTESNAQEDKGERQDEGETKNTSDQPDANAAAKAPDPNNEGKPKPAEPEKK
jgi:hypothetical protein